MLQPVEPRKKFLQKVVGTRSFSFEATFVTIRFIAFCQDINFFNLAISLLNLYINEIAALLHSAIFFLRFSAAPTNQSGTSGCMFGVSVR